MGRHEKTDASAKYVAAGALALFVLGILMELVLAGFYSHLISRWKKSISPLTSIREPAPVPPFPRLETESGAELRNLRKQEANILGGYGWIDKKAGVARIPIERAMELLLKKGLPARNPAGDSSEVPASIREVGIEQRLGAKIPRDLAFRDESGRSVRLSELTAGKPAILALAYYRCPHLCTLVLNGLFTSVEGLPLSPGKDYSLIALSIDPTETPELARDKKAAYLVRYPHIKDAHFLTGDESAVRALADSVGFHYKYDLETREFNHASGITLLTSEGVVSRYFLGIDYPAPELRLGLVKASGNRIGSLADQVLLFCYKYEHLVGKNSAAILATLRVLGMILTIGFFLVLIRWLRAEAQGGGS